MSSPGITAGVSQKEYLKKYLSIGKKSSKKKKKNKLPKVESRVKIIDDDIDVNNITSVEEAQELLGESEDAPQIVGVIDDRPLSLRVRDYQESNLWKPVGEIQNTELTTKSDNQEKRFQLKLKTNKNSQVEADLSPPRNIKSEIESNNSDRDLSPPRNNKIGRESKSSARDLSPPRNNKIGRELNSSVRDLSPPRKNRNSDSNDIINRTNKRKNSKSPPPKYHESIDEPGVKKKKYIIPQKRVTDKMTETLEGKKAGLQSARDLVKENESFKTREAEMFEKMSEEVSGKNATAIKRDRKSGKIRDLEKESEEQKKKDEKDAATKEKYTRWGKGLKQVEDRNEVILQELHEMNKPLARYADDEDLEKYLKEQEREGDPMLAYIRKKKQKKNIESGKPEKPTYQGEFMPNRFGIVPGHRWDGVDRSNGYEKRWFEVQNSQRAKQEDIYKWSTEDM